LKLLGYSYSHEETARIITLLKFNGIPILITLVSTHSMPHKEAIFVCIDSQLSDAKSLLLNRDHIVSNPVDIEEFEKLNEAIGHGPILKRASIILVIVFFLFALTVLIIWLTEKATPNYAIKGTSVETLDSSELSSGASVPYLGC
jgi:hypothetical protein